MTFSESCRYSQYIWNKVKRDYRVHEYYGIFRNEPSIYSIHISDFKKAIVEEMSEQFFGNKLEIRFLYNCPFCEYNREINEDGRCMCCPMFGKWNIGKGEKQMVCNDDKQSGYGKLEETGPGKEFYSLVCAIAAKISDFADHQF